VAVVATGTRADGDTGSPVAPSDPRNVPVAVPVAMELRTAPSALDPVRARR